MKTIAALFSYLIFFCASLHSQNLDFGLAVNLGMSKLVNLEESLPNAFRNEAQRWTLSGSTGVYLTRDIGKHSAIGLNLLVSSFRYRYSFDGEHYVYGRDGIRQNGVFEATSRDNLLYLSMPAFIRFKVSGYFMDIGIQPMLLMDAYAKNTIKSTIDGETTVDTGKFDTSGLEKWDIGPKLGLGYQFNDRLSITLQYYRGLIARNDGNSVYNSHNSQATLGLQYSLIKKSN